MHVSVLTEKVLEFLDPQPNQNFIDATLGTGGHVKAILEKTAPRGNILAIDWDLTAIKNAKAAMKRFSKRIIFAHDNFENLQEIVTREKFKAVNGILFDLGLSSMQLEESKRGFSFQKQETLDMRFNLEHGLNATKILNFWSRFDIERILKEYGEERFAPLIAKEIVQRRSIHPIVKTSELIEIIQHVTPKWYQSKKLHCATKTFQALRIAVNHELDSLTKALPQARDIVEKQGRIAVISFHSLEDRIVKHFFKDDPALKVFTKKPIIPSEEEQKNNPRSRSAKLRVAIKL